MNKMPVNDKIIVSLIQQKEEKIGSVVIPGTANAELLTGKAEAVSPHIIDPITKDPVYKVGDIIIYPKGCGVGQLINGIPHVWLRNDEIWGIDKPEKKKR